MPTSSSLLIHLRLLLSCAFAVAAGSSAVFHRRILHQPLLPENSTPQYQPPPPPNYPFLTNTPPDSAPFFPSYPSPPPPSPASLPVNISSLSVSNSSEQKPAFSKLIAAAIAAVAAALVIVSLAVFLRIRLRKRSRIDPPSVKQSKIPRSDSTPTTLSRTTNNLSISKLRRPSQTSSEFLYLGTLVSSQAIGSGIDFHRNSTSTTNRVNDSESRSPDLSPLPPLLVPSFQKFYSDSVDVASSKHDEEEFYSPKGSLNDRDSSIGAGSSSRRALAAIQIENYPSNSSSTYSCSVSGSGSGSPVRSVTLSVSPANSSSSINFIAKSQALIEIQTDSPLHGKIQSQDLVLLRSASSSPQNYSERESLPMMADVTGRSAKSPDETNSFVKDHVTHTPTIQPPSPPLPAYPPVSGLSPPTPVAFPFPPPVSIPHPPPPPPPTQNKLGESPRTPTPQAKKAPLEPPSLVAPLKPVAVESPSLVSPMELPSIDSRTAQTRDGRESPNRTNDWLNESGERNEENTPKPKLKPLHWDKVRASSDREMVWDQLKCSSFKLNEEMIETLFIVNAPKPSPREITRWQILPTPSQDNGHRILDPKKAQNIAILLRALNVTVEEVCEGLSKGCLDILSTELLESLLKMAPTKEEERKLKEHADDSQIKLGPAEKFLKNVLEIPYAFKRVDSMLYASNFQSEKEYLEKAFDTLEAACEELKSSRMFLKLLEAVLKTGNRMNVGTNRGDAHAFKLDTLLKLVDIKGADGKTTLLHFVVHEIIRIEGTRLSCTNPEDVSTVDDAKCRKLGLQVVSSISSELSNVKKAAAMDAEVLSSEVSNLSKGIASTREVVKLNESTSPKFLSSMNCFIEKAEADLVKIQDKESVALSLVKEITEYFHGNLAKEEAHPFRMFMVVRDFLNILDRVCKEVGSLNEPTTISSAHRFPVPVSPTLQQASARFLQTQQHSSSDEEARPHV